MAVTVEPIQLPRDITRFVKTWWPIYADDPHWVPPLIMERKVFLDPTKNVYFQKADVQLFVATRDGAAVGTISAQVDHAFQAKEPGVGFFGFFEFPDDEEVAGALLRAAEDWLRGRGMKEMRGPFNFNTNHEFGLLVDGFDTDPPLLNPHNRWYYERIYRSLGMEVAMDWYAYWLPKGPMPQNIADIANRLMQRKPEIELRMADLSDWETQVRWFFDIYNDAWHDNWGHVQVEWDEFKTIAAGIKEFADPRLIWFALVDGKPIAASLTFPDVNQVVKRMNGRLLPFGWWHWLFGRRDVDQIRVFALGVTTSWQRWPVGALLYYKTWEEGLKMNIRGADASLILHDNFRMRGALEKLGAHIYKTYRTYKKVLVSEGQA